MIIGPFADQVRGAEAAIARRRADPACSRCGSTDRLRFFAEWAESFRAYSGRALCYRCDDLGLTAGSRPRSTHSSLRAFYLWLLAAFIAGAIAGAAVASAFSGAPSTAHNTSGASSALTSAVDGGPVRAENGGTCGRTAASSAADREGADRLLRVDRPDGPEGLRPGVVLAHESNATSASDRVRGVPRAAAGEPDTRSSLPESPLREPAASRAGDDDREHRARRDADGTCAPDRAVQERAPADGPSSGVPRVPPRANAREEGSRPDVRAVSPEDVLAAIDAAAAEFGHDPERMRIVTFCESSWNPRAIGDGGTSFGLWQFQMPTWRANVRRGGFAYSDADVFDPVASSRVAAWMWANGGELLWTCARPAR